MIENTKNSWNSHWNKLNGSNLMNKTFMFFRKKVIAKHISDSLEKHFPKEGIFLDSGCGTSQTSLLIKKQKRKIIAMDICDIIFKEQPEMLDYKINGDVLNLPFKESSLDGIWNVGLMEHFSEEEVCYILREFHRVLRKEGKAVLFWPAVYGPINLVVKSLSLINKGMFPVEPSLLKSKKWAKKIGEKNGFKIEEIKWPLKGAFIHHTVVLKKL